MNRVAYERSLFKGRFKYQSVERINGGVCVCLSSNPSLESRTSQPASDKVDRNKSEVSQFRAARAA
jgi:hypothetical protein